MTRPDRYLILHGDDAPVADWLTMVIRSFRLQGSRYRVLFDEHERRLPDDCRRVQGALGILIQNRLRAEFWVEEMGQRDVR